MSSLHQKGMCTFMSTLSKETRLDIAYNKYVNSTVRAFKKFKKIRDSINAEPS